MADKKVEIITVKSNLTPVKARVLGGADEHRVAFWERHADHPGGEVTVTGEREVEVARTSSLNRALADEIVVRVDEPKKGKKAAAEPTP